MKKFDIKIQQEIYQSNFLKHGAVPQGTFQNNMETQYLRFDRLLKEFRPYFTKPISIHDVGTGVCDLHKYCTVNNLPHTYSGTELVQPMIDYSLETYPEIKLFNRDILAAPETEKYDILVLSGTFNILTDKEEICKDYVHSVLEKMYKMANIGISFNFLTTYKTRTDASLLYLNPTEIYDFCMRNLSRFVVLDNAFPLFETTVTVFNPTFLKEQFNNDAFLKYFS